MKKLYVTILAVAALASCGNKTNTESDTSSEKEATVNVDSLAEVKADSILKAKEAEEAKAAAAVDEAQKTMIDSFYSNLRNIDENLCRRYGTSRLMSQLKADYEYDGGGYAVWMLAGACCQDPGSIKYMGAKKIGDNLWQVALKDQQVNGIGCGQTTLINLTLVEEGGKWKIDKYKNL